MVRRGIKLTGDGNFLYRPMPGAETPWKDWLRTNFPDATGHPFSLRHERLWNWFDALTPGTRPRPRVEAWPRGGAKSSTGELGTVRLAVRLTRRFALYVSETQEQADKHVQTIATHFERIGVDRAVNKYGSSRGWRREQLRTGNGFNVAAYGLDVAARGVKLDNYRPDIIIFDDIDNRHDSEAAIKKKIECITDSLLPAGSSDCAVLFLQNLIHKDSIVSQLADGRADFLHDREPACVEPAVLGLEFEQRSRDDGTTYYAVTAGEPTWDGQSLATCEQQINSWGRRAFQREAQHRVDDDEDGLWQRERDIEQFRVTEHPPLQRVGVGVDPTASSTGDEAGIIAAGVAMVNGVLHGYILEDRSLQGSPSEWANAAVTSYKTRGGSVLVAEKNNGGEMVALTISTIPGAPKTDLVHASLGKQTRAEPVQKLAEDGRIHHVGVFPKLESELCNWQPGDPSPNRLDAYVWILTKLLLAAESTVPTTPPSSRYAGIARKN